MYDHPRLNPHLMTDPRFHYYLFTCGWLRDVFAPFYGDKCVIWHAGIDTQRWTDTRDHHKDIDVLIYDKMRWTRDVKERFLLQPIIEHITRRNHNYYVLRYGNISHNQYADLLSRSRCMVFLCEHETQGIAYQEGLASNVPILAWDPGYWVDPLWELLAENPVPATSVPQFSASCGMTFRKTYEFPDCFDKFYQQIAKYEPRRFVPGATLHERLSQNLPPVLQGMPDELVSGVLVVAYPGLGDACMSYPILWSLSRDQRFVGATISYPMTPLFRYLSRLGLPSLPRSVVTCKKQWYAFEPRVISVFWTGPVRRFDLAHL
jgi:hypothetical protein